MKKLMALLLASVLVFGLVACGQEEAAAPEGEADQSWQAILDKGELVVGNCPEYPPFSSRNEANEVEGFDTDYANALGEVLGVQVVMKDTAWEGLVAGLQKGDHDIIISCMSPEEATAASDNVNMSKEYYQLNEVIVTRTDVTTIASKEDLAGLVVGAQANSTSEVAADSLADMGIEVKELKKYNRNSEALIDLKNGRVDAVVVGIAYAADQLKKNPDLKIINDAVRSVPIVVILPQGADALTDKINEAIDTVKASGKYDEIYQKWIGL